MNKTMELMMEDTLRIARENGGLKMFRHLMPYLSAEVLAETWKNYADIVKEEV